MAWSDPTTYLDFAAGEFPTAAKLDRIKDNFKELWHPIGSAFVDTDLTITATDEATAHTSISATVTVSAPTVRLTFVCPAVEAASDRSVYLAFYDDATALGYSEVRALQGVGGLHRTPVHLFRQASALLASHVFSVKVWASADSCFLRAGAATVGAYDSMYLYVDQQG